MSGINSNSTENVPSGKVSDLIQRISVLEDVLCAAKEVLTLEEAAVFMGISRSTLYKMTHNNVIPFYRPNGNSSTLRSLSYWLGCVRTGLSHRKR